MITRCFQNLINRFKARTLKRKGTLIARFGWIAVASMLTPAARSEEQNANPQKPNIVLIYTDDLGYGDLRCYNPDRGRIPTPNIDSLAKQGMKFSDAHSSSAVCSPSRYTLLTGRYHWRTRLQRGIVNLWEPPLIKADRMTIGTLAREHGYKTACIGKWHLGWDWGIAKQQRQWLRNSGKDEQPAATAEHRAIWQQIFSKPIGGGPTTRGFDEYFGTDVPNWPPYCFIEQDRTIGIPSEFLPERLLQNNQASVPGPALENWSLQSILPALTDRVVAFIEREAKTPEPFLVYMPLTAPHTPLAVNQPWIGSSGLNEYADFVIETDAVVGRVLDAIADSGLGEKTLVVFTSDNGCAPYIGVKELEQQGHYPSGPLRGYKSDVWEGGHRVPLIVRWPGTVAAGSECKQLVHQADLLATLADILSVALPPTAGEDSFSMLPLLKGSDRSIRRQAVSCSIKGMPSIRNGHWKLILGTGSGGWTPGGDDQPAQLYNLADDLGEKINLAEAHPERVQAMANLMEQLIADGRSTPGPTQPNDVKVIRHRKLGN